MRASAQAVSAGEVTTKLFTPYTDKALRTMLDGFILALLTLNVLGAEPPGNHPMPLGVDDAGNRNPIHGDPVLAEAFEQMGFDFLMHHIWRGADTERGLNAIRSLNEWAARTGHDYVINLENTDRQRGNHPALTRPGFFFQPSREWLAECLSSEHFRGVCYDEAEHWITNGVGVTGGAHSVKEFRPHFFDAENQSIVDAYDSNLKNLQVVREEIYGFKPATLPDASQPIVRTEHVFPILFPLFAREGIAPHPKLLKESVTPVVTAAALGACRQYGVPYVPCLDLWGPRDSRGSRTEWPFHTPEELRSALLFSYWTGAHAAYIENVNYQDSLYRTVDGKPELTAWGQTARDFRRQYMPNHPRQIRAEHFRPEIVIARFPDTDWGQPSKHHIRKNLYGASNLKPDSATQTWIGIWHLLTHRTIPNVGLTWHSDGFSIPYRFFVPSNSVALYDHLADDPALYQGVRLIFLTGIQIPRKTLATVEEFVQAGGTAATTPALAPPAIRAAHDGDVSVIDDGKGQWIVFERTDHPRLQSAIAPFLGKPNQLRYTFLEHEVVFTAPHDHGELQVEVRPIKQQERP
jgi:hypothetical protein